LRPETDNVTESQNTDRKFSQEIENNVLRVIVESENDYGITTKQVFEKSDLADT